MLSLNVILLPATKSNVSVAPIALPSTSTVLNVFVSADDIVITPAASDNVILVPFLNLNVSLASKVLLALPFPLLSTSTVLNVLVSVSVAAIVIAPLFSDSVTFVPPIKFNVSVEPIDAPSACTVLNVFVSVV